MRGTRDQEQGESGRAERITLKIRAKARAQLFDFQQAIPPARPLRSCSSAARAWQD